MSRVKLLFILGFGMRRQNWLREAEHVRRNIHWIDGVMVSTGHPLGSYEQRAAAIMAETNGWIQPEDRLIILAHSFGGIVARYMTSERMLNPAVIVTIATPHYGVQHCDLYLRVVHGVPVMGSLVKGGNVMVKRVLGATPGAFEQMSTAGMTAFNATYPDRPDVIYQSYACVAERVSWSLWPAFRLLSAYTGLPNDGLIALPSTRWGEFMGIVPCDHNEVVGWSGPNRFDAVQFVVDVLERLRDVVVQGDRVMESTK